MKKIAIIGGGKFGLAIAYACGKSELNVVSIFSRRREIVDHINQHGTHPALQQYNMHVVGCPSLADAINDADFIFIATSSQELPDLVVSMKEIVGQKSPAIIICSKGIDYRNGSMFFSDLLESAMPQSEIGILSGPSFASEILDGVATRVNLACRSKSLASDVSEILAKSSIKAQHTEDVRAVQLLGAYKNIIGIRIGIEEGFIEHALLDRIEGSSSCRNKVAAIFCELVGEAGDLLASIKSSKEELFSYAGLGDMVLTAYSDKSRNMSLGKSIGTKIFNQIVKREKKNEEVIRDFMSNINFFDQCEIDYASLRKDLGHESERAEGKYAVSKLLGYSKEKGVKMPHLLFLHKILNDVESG